LLGEFLEEQQKKFGSTGPQDTRQVNEKGHNMDCVSPSEQQNFGGVVAKVWLYEKYASFLFLLWVLTQPNGACY